MDPRSKLIFMETGTKGSYKIYKAILFTNKWIAFIKVNCLVQNSNQLLEDLRRINKLKDSPYQYDLEVNQPNYIHSKKTQRLPLIVSNTRKRD